MINLLVVCENIGKSASGLVIENILKYLDSNSNFKLTIIANQSFSKHYFTDLRLIDYNRQVIDINYKLSLILTGKEPGSKLWVKEGLKKIEKSQFDLVFGITSAYSFRTFQLVYEIYKKKRFPYILHGLDPMPSLLAWGEHEILRFAIKKAVRPYYFSAKILSASNKSMIDYQLKILNITDKISTYFYNPSNNLNFQSINEVKSLDTKQEIKLLYLGTLYEKRSPNNLLDAIANLNQVGYNITITFVGNVNNKHLKEIMKKFNFLTFLPFQEDTDSVINEHHILVDIDANISNDVFISSKLNFYLSLSRPILSITFTNSPSFKMVEELKNTVKTSENKLESIYDAILCLIKYESYDYAERNSLLNEISLETVGKKIESTIISIVS